MLKQLAVSYTHLDVYKRHNMFRFSFLSTLLLRMY
ncbi:hypothetical protein AZ004_003439, partial [Escherichia coli]